MIKELLAKIKDEAFAVSTWTGGTVEAFYEGLKRRPEVQELRKAIAKKVVQA